MFAPPSPSNAPISDDADMDINFDELQRAIDKYFADLPPAEFEQFSFELDGIPIEVRRIKQTTGNQFLITAMLGYQPYTMESPERRQAIRLIVDATRDLRNVHFTIDQQGKITAGGLFDVTHVAAPDFLFYPLTLFLQEAQPFMELIAQYIES